MVFKCCVTGCNSNYRNGPRVTVFRFPRDENLKEKWLKNIPRENYNVTDSSRAMAFIEEVPSNLKPNLISVYRLESPNILLSITKTVVAMSMCLRGTTLYFYLGTLACLFIPIITESHAQFYVPWLIMALIRCVIFNIFLLFSGFCVCLVFAPIKPACLEFMFVKMLEAVIYTYYWIKINRAYIQLCRQTGVKYIHFLKHFQNKDEFRRQEMDYRRRRLRMLGNSVPPTRRHRLPDSELNDDTSACSTAGSDYSFSTKYSRSVDSFFAQATIEWFIKEALVHQRFEKDDDKYERDLAERASKFLQNAMCEESEGRQPCEHDHDEGGISISLDSEFEVMTSQTVTLHATELYPNEVGAESCGYRVVTPAELHHGKKYGSVTPAESHQGKKYGREDRVKILSQNESVESKESEENNMTLLIDTVKGCDGKKDLLASGVGIIKECDGNENLLAVGASTIIGWDGEETVLPSGVSAIETHGIKENVAILRNRLAKTEEVNKSETKVVTSPEQHEFEETEKDEVTMKRKSTKDEGVGEENAVRQGNILTGRSAEEVETSEVKSASSSTGNSYVKELLKNDTILESKVASELIVKDEVKEVERMEVMLKDEVAKRNEVEVMVISRNERIERDEDKEVEKKIKSENSSTRGGEIEDVKEDAVAMKSTSKSSTAVDLTAGDGPSEFSENEDVENVMIFDNTLIEKVNAAETVVNVSTNDVKNSKSDEKSIAAIKEFKETQQVLETDGCSSSKLESADKSEFQSTESYFPNSQNGERLETQDEPCAAGVIKLRDSEHSRPEEYHIISLASVPHTKQGLNTFALESRITEKPDVRDQNDPTNDDGEYYLAAKRLTTTENVSAVNQSESPTHAVEKNEYDPISLPSPTDQSLLNHKNPISISLEGRQVDIISTPHVTPAVDSESTFYQSASIRGIKKLGATLSQNERTESIDSETEQSVEGKNLLPSLNKVIGIADSSYTDVVTPVNQVPDIYSSLSDEICRTLQRNHSACYSQSIEGTRLEAGSVNVSKTEFEPCPSKADEIATTELDIVLHSDASVDDATIAKPGFTGSTFDVTTVDHASLIGNPKVSTFLGDKTSENKIFGHVSLNEVPVISKPGLDIARDDISNYSVSWIEKLEVRKRVTDQTSDATSVDQDPSIKIPTVGELVTESPRDVTSKGRSSLPEEPIVSKHDFVLTSDDPPTKIFEATYDHKTEINCDDVGTTKVQEADSSMVFNEMDKNDQFSTVKHFSSDHGLVFKLNQPLISNGRHRISRPVRNPDETSASEGRLKVVESEIIDDTVTSESTVENKSADNSLNMTVRFKADHSSYSAMSIPDTPNSSSETSLLVKVAPVSERLTSTKITEESPNPVVCSSVKEEESKLDCSASLDKTSVFNRLSKTGVFQMILDRFSSFSSVDESHSSPDEAQTHLIAAPTSCTLSVEKDLVDRTFNTLTPPTGYLQTISLPTHRSTILCDKSKTSLSSEDAGKNPSDISISDRGKIEPSSCKSTTKVFQMLMAKFSSQPDFQGSAPVQDITNLSVDASVIPQISHLTKSSSKYAELSPVTQVYNSTGESEYFPNKLEKLRSDSKNSADRFFPVKSTISSKKPLLLQNLENGEKIPPLVNRSTTSELFQKLVAKFSASAVQISSSEESCTSTQEKHPLSDSSFAAKVVPSTNNFRHPKERISGNKIDQYAVFGSGEKKISLPLQDPDAPNLSPNNSNLDEQQNLAFRFDKMTKTSSDMSLQEVSSATHHPVADCKKDLNVELTATQDIIVDHNLPLKENTSPLINPKRKDPFLGKCISVNKRPALNDNASNHDETLIPYGNEIFNKSPSADPNSNASESDLLVVESLPLKKSSPNQVSTLESQLKLVQTTSDSTDRIQQKNDLESPSGTIKIENRPFDTVRNFFANHNPIFTKPPAIHSSSNTRGFSNNRPLKPKHALNENLTIPQKHVSINPRVCSEVMKTQVRPVFGNLKPADSPPVTGEDIPKNRSDQISETTSRIDQTLGSQEDVPVCGVVATDVLPVSRTSTIEFLICKLLTDRNETEADEKSEQRQ